MIRLSPKSALFSACPRQNDTTWLRQRLDSGLSVVRVKAARAKKGNYVCNSPDRTRRDWTRPDATRLDMTRPTRPDQTRRDATKPDPTGLDLTGPTRPGLTRPT